MGRHEKLYEVLEVRVAKKKEQVKDGGYGNI